mmetsp:Transcript_82395/g.130299  ORF Transcript_82395/g.130299 Transcript_82395/m.130299 type:complete len:223 (+) Transcript_82395:537-1205(+)
MLQALIHLLQVGAGTWGKVDAQHAEQHSPLARLGHLRSTFVDNHIKRHPGRFNATTALLLRFLQASVLTLAGTVRVEKHLHISVFHPFEVQFIPSRASCLFAAEHDPRKARGTAVPIQHQMDRIVILKRLRVMTQEVPDILHRRLVWQAAKLDGQVALILLIEEHRLIPSRLAALGQRVSFGRRRVGLLLRLGGRGVHLALWNTGTDGEHHHLLILLAHQLK